MIHIRRIRESCTLNGIEAAEQGGVEIGKAPTFQFGTVGSFPWFEFHITMTGWGTTGAAVDDVDAVSTHEEMLFGKGQLTLEPNESLFTNIAKGSGGSLGARHMIGYEFA